MELNKQRLFIAGKQELVQTVQARRFPAELWGKAEKSCPGNVHLPGPDLPVRKAGMNFWECRGISLSLNSITEVVVVLLLVVVVIVVWSHA